MKNEMLKAYKAVFEDNDDLLTEVIPAYSADDAENILKTVYGYEAIYIKDVTKNYTIDTNRIFNVLKNDGYSNEDLYFIVRILQKYSNSI